MILVVFFDNQTSDTDMYSAHIQNSLESLWNALCEM